MLSLPNWSVSLWCTRLVWTVKDIQGSRMYDEYLQACKVVAVFVLSICFMIVGLEDMKLQLSKLDVAQT